MGCLAASVRPFPGWASLLEVVAPERCAGRCYADRGRASGQHYPGVKIGRRSPPSRSTLRGVLRPSTPFSRYAGTAPLPPESGLGSSATNTSPARAALASARMAFISGLPFLLAPSACGACALSPSQPAGRIWRCVRTVTELPLWQALRAEHENTYEGGRQRRHGDPASVLCSGRFRPRHPS